MGMFDYVHVDGDAYTCSEGHPLAEESFQTKDLGCTLAIWEIGGIGSALTMGVVGLVDGDPDPGDVTDYLEIGCQCPKCPAFVQHITHNMVGCEVEFRIHVVRGIVRAIERTSMDTKSWLEWLPQQDWMWKAIGPMSLSEAESYRREYSGRTWTREEREEFDRQKKVQR